MTKQIGDGGWNFDNSYARLANFFFTKVEPRPVQTPKSIIINDELAVFLGLDVNFFKSEMGVACLAGNQFPKGSLPLAQAYAGHQFGHFTILGDGRALLIGEQITPSGERYDIQLKGSGPTPYSRGGDGHATLGPMLREYIISEAMFGLGIPTTRSLGVVTTGELIQRETFLPGAILSRVAASHLRVGTFQYVTARGSETELKMLADYAIARHYPDLMGKENKYQLLLQKVIKAQASLIAKWQLVGFIHGVMNTDNMTISGETIDYGPCAFMDTYDPKTVFSSIDRNGRYAYANQPKIAAWNLARFAETLLPLLHNSLEGAKEVAQNEIDRFTNLYSEYWLNGMRAKLGLGNEEPDDQSLIQDLLQLMHEHKADYTNTFLALTFNKQGQAALFNSKGFTRWHGRWQDRLKRQLSGIASAQQLMKKKNPAVIPRNHRVEEALRASVQDDEHSSVKRLLDIFKDPFAHRPEQEEFAKPPSPSAIPYKTFCGT